MAINFVPVVDANRIPLMPTSGKRARKLIQRGDATPFFSHGIFCIRLNRKPSGSHTQPIAVGVDPGSKREGFSIRSQAHDYLNLDADAKTWVGKKLQARRVMRQVRRYRKTPAENPRATTTTIAASLPERAPDGTGNYKSSNASHAYTRLPTSS